MSGPQSQARFTVELPVIIRPCVEADLPALEWYGAFSHHRAIIREAFDLQQQGEALMLLAEAHGFPVGQAWLDLRPRPDAFGPLVWAVRVLEPLQGLGLGGRLMSALEAAAAGLGHPTLELGVEKANPAARRFYERGGWRVAGDRQERYAYRLPDGQAVEHALDEWVMVKTLSQAGGDSPTRR